MSPSEGSCQLQAVCYITLRSMKLFLGIDGGQTSIKSVLANQRGRILGTGSGGPAVHFRDEATRHQVRESLSRAIQEALRQAGLSVTQEIESAFLGVSGVNGPESPAGTIYRDMIQEEFKARKICVDLDARIALAGAIPSRVGVIVIAGTGSIAFGMNERGESARVGGWGYLLGDEGSGYDIGRQALIAVGKESDGLGPTTALTPLILQSLNIKGATLIPQIIYRDPAPKLRIAHLCSIAAQAAQRGDAIARRLFSKGGKSLGGMACSIIRRLHFDGLSVLVSGVGGVFHAGELIWNPYRQEVLRRFPEAEVAPPRFPPVVGALLLAYQNGGEPLSRQLLQALSSTNSTN